MLGFDEDLDQTVQKSREPEEPLQESCGQYETHDANIDDLLEISNAVGFLGLGSYTYICHRPCVRGGRHNIRFSKSSRSCRVYKLIRVSNGAMMMVVDVATVW